jgi:hypothetical protein
MAMGTDTTAARTLAMCHGLFIVISGIVIPGLDPGIPPAAGVNNNPRIKFGDDEVRQPEAHPWQPEAQP